MLLNPASWEDINDSFYIEQYRIKKNLKAVLALCFTTRAETFHHWKIFSGGSSGVCIRFYRTTFLQCVRDVQGTHSKSVKYRLVKELKENPPPLEDWPFLKRKPFRDEGEFRIIYENSETCEETKAIPFDVNCIHWISLSPWLPRSIMETVKKVIKAIDGCEKVPVNRSTLIENLGWRSAIENTPACS